MARRRTAKAKPLTNKELTDIIRKAQEEPGLADLVALSEQSNEIAAIMREEREAAIETSIVSATSTVT